MKNIYGETEHKDRLEKHVYCTERVEDKDSIFVLEKVVYSLTKRDIFPVIDYHPNLT